MNTTENRLKEISKAIGMEMDEVELALLSKEIDEETSNKTNTLTDEQFGDVVKALTEAREENGYAPKNMLEMPTQEELDSYKESMEMQGTPTEGYLVIDPITGLGHVDTEIDIESKLDMEATVDSMFKGKDLDTILNSEAIQAALKSYDIKDEDAVGMIRLIQMVKSEGYKGEPIFGLMPKNLQNVIINTIPAEYRTREAAEIMAQESITAILTDAAFDQVFIDFNTALSTEMGNMSEGKMIDMHTSDIVQRMEVEYVALADKYEASGDLDRARTFRLLSSNFTKSYTLSPLIDKINIKKSVINKQLTKQLNTGEFEKHCKDIDKMYQGSNFTCKDFRGVLPILDRRLPDGIHIDSIKKCLMLFLSIANKRHTITVIHGNSIKEERIDPTHHVFIYYFIEFVYRLDVTNIDEEFSDFNKTFIANIVSVIEAIES